MITLIMLIAMLLFGVLHSFAAGTRLKMAMRQRLGERAYHGWYRIGYNTFATITLIPIAVLLLFFPGESIWQVGGGLDTAFRAVQAVGLIGLIVSLLQIDLGQFSGLSQLRAYLANAPLPLPNEPLQTGGVYRLFRHPLYVFSLLVIWFQPTMTEAMLAFNIGATIYFLLGSLLEERRLIAFFGDEYREYQERVGWMLPRLRRKINKLSVERPPQLR